MPFKSEAQRRFFYAKADEPGAEGQKFKKIRDKMRAKTPKGAQLPERVKAASAADLEELAFLSMVDELEKIATAKELAIGGKFVEGVSKLLSKKYTPTFRRGGLRLAKAMQGAPETFDRAGGALTEYLKESNRPGRRGMIRDTAANLAGAAVSDPMPGALTSVLPGPANIPYQEGRAALADLASRFAGDTPAQRAKFVDKMRRSPVITSDMKIKGVESMTGAKREAASLLNSVIDRYSQNLPMTKKQRRRLSEISPAPTGIATGSGPKPTPGSEPPRRLTSVRRRGSRADRSQSRLIGN